MKKRRIIIVCPACGSIVKRTRLVSSYMTIDPQGRVGIGSTTPAKKIDINLVTQKKNRVKLKKTIMHTGGERKK